MACASCDRMAVIGEVNPKEEPPQPFENKAKTPRSNDFMITVCYQCDKSQSGDCTIPNAGKFQMSKNLSLSKSIIESWKVYRITAEHVGGVQNLNICEKIKDRLEILHHKFESSSPFLLNPSSVASVIIADKTGSREGVQLEEAKYLDAGFF